MDRIAVFAKARTQIVQQLQISPSITGALLTGDGNIQAKTLVDVVARLAIKGQKFPRMSPVETCRKVPCDPPHLGCLVISPDEGIASVQLVAIDHLARGNEYLP